MPRNGYSALHGVNPNWKKPLPIKFCTESRVKTIWQMSSCFRVFRALGQFGETVPKYSTPNRLGYTESKAKSSIPHLAPSEVFRIIFIEAFQAIDLIFAIHFSIWACTLMKKQKSNDQSKFVYQTIMKSWKDFQLFDQSPVFSAK